MNEITKSMVEYCKRRMKEVPVKSSYYEKIKKELENETNSIQRTHRKSFSKQR